MFFLIGISFFESGCPANKVIAEWAGYAPPSWWGVPIKVYSYIGAASFTIETVRTAGPQVRTQVSYWRDGKYITSEFASDDFYFTANDAANIYVSYYGNPTGQTVTGKLC